MREAEKNSSSLNGRAIKRGGGGKGPAIKEKYLFLKLFKKYLMPFKNKNYFIETTKYGHIISKFVGKYLDCYNIFQILGLF